MRLLKRQQTAFEYMPNLGVQEILEDGKHTGRYCPRYGGRVTYKGNVAMPTGYVQATWFGIDKDYSHILLMEDPKAPIKEDGIIEWDGNTYVIQAVKPSYNFLSIAMRVITKEEADALKKALSQQQQEASSGSETPTETEVTGGE